jgi:hypothetical protein
MVRSCVLNLIKVVGDALNGTKQLELVLDLDQVVTGGRVETSGHLNGQRDEVLHNLTNDVADTVLTLIGSNGWVKLHSAVLQ